MASGDFVIEAPSVRPGTPRVLSYVPDGWKVNSGITPMRPSGLTTMVLRGDVAAVSVTGSFHQVCPLAAGSDAGSKRGPRSRRRGAGRKQCNKRNDRCRFRLMRVRL